MIQLEVVFVKGIRTVPIHSFACPIVSAPFVEKHNFIFLNLHTVKMDLLHRVCVYTSEF